MCLEMSALYLIVLTFSFIMSQTCEQHCNYIHTSWTCWGSSLYFIYEDSLYLQVIEVQEESSEERDTWVLFLFFSVVRADGLPACWLRKLWREKKNLNFNWKNEFLLIEVNRNFGGSGASSRRFFRRPRRACLRACHSVGPWPSLSSAEELLGTVRGQSLFWAGKVPLWLLEDEQGRVTVLDAAVVLVLTEWRWGQSSKCWPLIVLIIKEYGYRSSFSFNRSRVLWILPELCINWVYILFCFLLFHFQSEKKNTHIWP